MTEVFKATLARNPDGERAVIEFTFEDRDGTAFQTIEHEQAPSTIRGLSWGVSTFKGSREQSWGRPEVPDDILDGTIILEEGWTIEAVKELLAIGAEWHTNYLNAGCAHQTIEYETDRYGRRVPSLTQTKPCAESGYRYGHAWLVRLLPPEVEARVREIFAEAGA